jgi:GGDEF domain-containing protein
VAERLCQAVATASATWPLPVTVSVGLAAFPFDGLGATELLHAAVEANQRAKQAGKNRVA